MYQTNTPLNAGSTLGTIDVGVLLCSMLYGMTTIQVYIYIVMARKRDKGLFRALILLIWLLESLHLAFVFIHFWSINIVASPERAVQSFALATCMYELIAPLVQLDLWTSVALIWVLRKQRGGYRETDYIINRAIIRAMETGVVICFVMAMIVFFYKLAPQTNIDVTLILFYGSLYSNSLLVSLNTRMPRSEDWGEAQTGLRFESDYVNRTVDVKI